ncbi:MAG: hypothetical protein ACRDLP_02600 [Solirubrobacteraceae bacterium]
MDDTDASDEVTELFAVAIRCLRTIGAALEPDDYLAGECTMLAHSLGHRVRCGELPPPREMLAVAGDASR